MMYVWLVVGFVLLIKGADWFVDGSSSIARLLKVPSIIIGLTIVAMGTSAPEAAVSISAAIRHQNDIALSNVIGSNMFNLLMVVGVCALMKRMNVTKEILHRDFPVNLFVTFLLLFFCLDCILFGNTALISRSDGIVLLVVFVAYMIWLVIATCKKRKQEEPVEKPKKTISPLKSVFYILLGATGIVLGGQLVVDNASEIAKTFGLSQTLIGLTIVACGTSLPELVTSIVASRKGENELALGNVIGSNLFNVLMVLGMSATISPIHVSVLAITDMVILSIVTVIVYIMVLVKKDANRFEGFLMFLMYIVYMVYAVIRPQ